MPSFFRFLMPLLLAPALCACSYASKAVDTATGPYGRGSIDLAAQPMLYLQSKVFLSDIQVMVHPNINLEEAPTALFVPLGLTQDMRDAVRISQGVSVQVWQQFLREGTFSTLELADTKPPYRVEHALPLARGLKADMLVGGYITYYLDGGATGDTKISLQIEVYDVKSGEMVWSVAHAGLLPHQVTRDYLLVGTRTRMPADPMATVIAAVSADMAELLHMWTEPNAPHGQARNGGSANGTSRDGPSAFGRF